MKDDINEYMNSQRPYHIETRRKPRPNLQRMLATLNDINWSISFYRS